jgi:hypothetical protein
VQRVVGALAICSAFFAIGCHAAPVAEKTLEDAAPSPSTASPVASADSDAAPSFDASAPSDLATSPPTRAKSIGHTSVVFKVTLAGGSEAAFKPESHRGKTRYRGEIATFRLGQALGISNVPPALFRRFRAGELRSALGGGEAEQLFDREVVIDPEGAVRGAIIPWIKGLEFLPLETPAWRARWQTWLSRSGDLKPEDRALASQISTLIVFDVITGNWDRWSGGNVGYERSTMHVLFIDNDGAFFDPVPTGPAEAQLALLRKTDRFSRAFVTNLRALDSAKLAAAFGDEAPGVPLLSAHALEEAEKRRMSALSIIETKIASRGEKDVLFFE